MICAIDATHDPNLLSWVESANTADTEFPIQNLPFGVFQRLGSNDAPRIGVAIGDQILDLAACRTIGALAALPEPLQVACAAPTLNALMAMGKAASLPLRHHLSQLLRMGQEPVAASQMLVPRADVQMRLPATIGDYTDFYASIFHATNVGRLFRPDNPLLPNYQYVPIAYHGRASSIVPSGTPIQRPSGQQKRPEDTAPSFGPSQMLDYELEVGCFVGMGNALGEPIALPQAEGHLFGLCLVNDWSARDIQAWEYQPLGPFLAKSFATTISPWVVTMEALAPFRCAAFTKSSEAPETLPYLTASVNQARGGIALTLEVFLTSAQMRQAGIAPLRLSRSPFQQMYWTVAQMLTHHTSNGCNLRPGDLLASGTVSGANAGTQGCLLEITQRGKQPLTLPTGEVRSFLQAGDEVTLRGYCDRQGYPKIGFGECRGQVIS
ncbi:fumarylacetoacetase [Oculatella sp. LEGE 06141]|uniref:fumarylacetoacetase n=1 Tax=Oculatella sp. LEGE 06141 TaxID=1828648 RepID=UPI001880B4E4|nr:fumarylacetoacetase [Oculatella sp. LEGE 06141]MBE9179103.1 fumarylacetoacetase [Oculatella sp. LEGE 06141]